MGQEGVFFGETLNSLRSKLLRHLFWVLIVLGFVFAVAAGVETARYIKDKNLVAKYAAAGDTLFQKGDDYSALPTVSLGGKKAMRVFGLILRVEANRIHILNNAATEQTILSGADTQIYSSTAEIGLTSLVPGREAVFTGYLDKDGLLQAKLIEQK